MRTAGLLLIAAAILLSQQTSPSDRWAPLSFLMGEWTGEGTGDPGQGVGGFSFLPDQDGNVLIRKNRADYPAANGKPAFSHTDLMVIYKEANDPKLRAIYFDSEDHVIHYTVEPAPDGTSVQFLSPTYRLTYSKTGADTLSIRFEIAPPDHPGAYKTYIHATARRKSR